MNAQEFTHEEAIAVIEDIQNYLKKQAIMAAFRMNQQAAEGDVNRNHVNYGSMAQALAVLSHLGHFTENNTWGDGDMLICERVIVDDKVIYTKH